MSRLRLGIIAICLMLTGLPVVAIQPTSAQETEAEPALVYGINAAVPNNFVGTFAPPSVDTIYLLADQTSVISARITEIYFWPISNEYRANWSTMNEHVPGTLEIYEGDDLVDEIAATDYTIHFEQDGEVRSAELFTGEEALAAHDRFLQRQEEFRQESAAYYEAQQEWIDAVAEARERQEAGEDVELPPEPEPPDEIGIFSNGLAQGFPIDLDPGTYRVQVRGEDGEIVEDSHKDLTIFEPRRTGVGYTIVPETRWTTPENSNAPEDVIFGEADSNLYLEPHVTREFPARAWERLHNPQRPEEVTGEWEWVSGEMLRDGSLEILVDGEVVEQVDLKPFAVEQIPGRQLGYEVKDFVAGAEGMPNAPDFEAFPINLDHAGEAYSMRLVAEDGNVMAGSTRMARVPSESSLASLLVLPLIPLGLGGVVIVRRRQRLHKPRNMDG